MRIHVHGGSLVIIIHKISHKRLEKTIIKDVFLFFGQINKAIEMEMALLTELICTGRSINDT
jgi:hypothetical protein